MFLSPGSSSVKKTFHFTLCGPSSLGGGNVRDSSNTLVTEYSVSRKKLWLSCPQCSVWRSLREEARFLCESGIFTHFSLLKKNQIITAYLHVSCKSRLPPPWWEKFLLFSCSSCFRSPLPTSALAAVAALISAIPSTFHLKLLESSAKRTRSGASKLLLFLLLPANFSSRSEGWSCLELPKDSSWSSAEKLDRIGTNSFKCEFFGRWKQGEDEPRAVGVMARRRTRAANSRTRRSLEGSLSYNCIQIHVGDVGKMEFRPQARRSECKHERAGSSLGSARGGSLLVANRAQHDFFDLEPNEATLTTSGRLDESVRMLVCSG